MFISSYNTYINAINTTNKPEKKLQEDSKTTFTLKDTKNTLSKNLLNFSNNSQHIDYLSSSKVFQNKLILEYQQEQMQNPKSKEKLSTLERITKQFNKPISLENISSIYIQNSKKFSIMKKPLSPICQKEPQKSEKNFSLNRAKEKILREEMINTYIQNENYFNIPA